MRPGETFRIPTLFRDSGGYPVDYASKSAMEADGWALKFLKHQDGSDVTSSVTWSLVAPTSGHLHWVSITIPALDVVAYWTTPTGTDAPWFPVNLLDATVYNVDAILARLTTVIASTGITGSAASVTITVPMENSIAASMTVPTSVLTSVGWSSLSGVTLSGAVRLSNDNDPTASPLVTLDSYLTNPSGNDVKLAWNTMPSALDTVMDADALGAGRKDLLYTIRGTKSGVVRDLISGKMTILRSEVRS